MALHGLWPLLAIATSPGPDPGAEICTAGAGGHVPAEGTSGPDKQERAPCCPVCNFGSDAALLPRLEVALGDAPPGDAPAASRDPAAAPCAVHSSAQARAPPYCL